jgi:hypothetical protein
MTESVMDDKQNQAGKEADDRQPSDMHRRQRGRNIALAAVLFGLAILFYVVAIVKMGGS